MTLLTGDFFPAAADYITTHGWAQGAMEEADGRVCLTGALRACTPQPGDWLIARAVARHQGHAEGWNDDPSRTEGEVTAWLRTATVTDTDLEGVFGPQWAEVVALVRRVATLTPDDVVTLAASRDAAGDAARDAARGAARDAAWGAARDAAWGAAWVAAWDAACWGAARDAAWDAACWGAARDAACALSARDLIGQRGFTRDIYDTLTRPWRTTIGAIHPDDTEL